MLLFYASKRYITSILSYHNQHLSASKNKRTFRRFPLQVLRGYGTIETRIEKGDCFVPKLFFVSSVQVAAVLRRANRFM